MGLKTSVLVACMAGATPLAGSAQDSPAGSRSAADSAIIAARAGGTILLCRHARTMRFQEREPIDYGDVASQRRLSDDGRLQARVLRRGLRDSGVEIGDIVASPMDRAIETAVFMAGTPTVDSIWHTNDGDYSGPARHRRLQALTDSVAHGNRLIVSHISTMGSVVPQVTGQVGEGDCAVLRPLPSGHSFIGIVPDSAWRAPRGGDSGGMLCPVCAKAPQRTR